MEKESMMLPEEIEQAVRTLENPDIADFRSKGGRTIGFFCSYVPEELLNVEGLASFRMRAVDCRGSEIADSYMGVFNCSYTRQCLEKGLQGAYDFLDGFVFVPGCDHLRRLYDNWAHFVKPAFLALVDAPHVRDEDALKWYRDEIECLWEKLAGQFSLPQEHEAVWAGIRKTNRTRQLLEELDRRRWQDPPGLSGARMQEISLFAASVPKERANPVLEDLIAHAKTEALTEPYRARVLLVGSHLDDPGFVGVLEETGALVVREAYCCGLRDQLGLVADVGEERDPFAAIARRYLDRLSCPRMYGDYPRRMERIVRMAEEARVDGIILEQLKFCETWGIDGNVLQNDLKARGFPVLRLEREYLLSGKGQTRTRVQAFLESMGK
jgi:benzoyl-CoA reductase/2-hydroxyglutaryl-CoA dehydratase subunit BcrC/BadD/HgdB